MHLGAITTDNTERPQMWMKGKMDFEGNYFPQVPAGGLVLVLVLPLAWGRE